MVYLVNFIKIVISIGVVGYLVFASLLFVYQRQFLYAPTAASPHVFPVESVDVEGDRIDLLVLNSGKEKAILYFPGNAESVASSAPLMAQALPEYSIYMMNYPGYATSTGAPSEKAIYAASNALFERINSRHSTVSILGRSLGTGVATYLSSREDIAKLALITPFDSITNIAQKRFPFFPISFLLKDRFDSLSRVNKIEAETLILIAELDQIIPFENTDRLAKEFPAMQLQTQILKGVGHNDLSNNPEYISMLRAFFVER